MQRIDLRCKQLAPFLKKRNETAGGLKAINHKENQKMKKNSSKHGRLLGSEEPV